MHTYLEEFKKIEKVIHGEVTDKSFKWVFWPSNLSGRLTAIAAYTFILSFVCALFLRYINSESRISLWVGQLSLLSSFVTYIAGIVAGLVEARKDIITFFSKPESFFILRSDDIDKDIEALNILRNIEPERLRFWKQFLENQIEEKSKRFGLLTGTLDKVGIFPAFIGYYLSWNSLYTVSTVEAYSLLTPIVYSMLAAIIIFHLAGISFHATVARTNRLINLIEYVLEGDKVLDNKVILRNGK